MTTIIALTCGENISDWTLINPDGDRHWICRCKCGTEKRVDKYSLKNGSSKRCRTCACREMKRSKFAKDLSGKTYGDWTVLSRADGEFDIPYWNCQCKCGYDKIVSGSSLRKGGSKSCRLCSVKKQKRPKGLKSAPDLIGKKFNNWTVIQKEQSRYGKSRWLCKCKCGIEKIVTGQSLMNGSSTKCVGCVEKIGNIKHGHTIGGKPKEYHIWRSIKERCLNVNNKGYASYGGRGITICKKWSDSFDEFFTYVGKKPAPGYSIDRIDNDGNYEPGNVRWATKQTQAANTRSQKYGICVTQWSREKNLCRFQVAKKLKNGISLDEIEKTVTKKYKEYKYTGLDIDLTP